MSLAIVTGTLTPYTVRAYGAFTERCGEDLHVFTCAAVEPHRFWTIEPVTRFRHAVLPGLRWHRDYVSHIYLNPSVMTALARLRPEAILLAAFSPTMLLASLYARLTRTPYGLATDGTLATDPGASSSIHAAMRRLMVPAARFGVCASEASVELLEHWGLAPGAGIVVPIVSAWDAPSEAPGFAARPFDLLYAGGLDDRYKGVLFFVEVVEALARHGERLKVRVAGDGPERATVEARLRRTCLEVHFDGSVEPQRMPAVLSSARLLLFPSRQDAWGLVANEATLCGTPVLGSPHATSSHYFVERFGTGLVRPLEIGAWCEAVTEMLASPERWQGFMARRGDAIAWFSLDRAVAGLKSAFDLARGPQLPSPAAADGTWPASRG